MLGIAVIGTGDISNFHIESYLAFKDRCGIIAVADIFAEKARKKADDYGLDCEIVGDYKELLERTDIGLVSICLPPSLHCEVSVAFLLAGKHVLCEKPMAPTLEECDRMIAAAKKGNAILSIVAQNRFKSEIMRTKRFLDTGALGKILFAQAGSLWWRGSNYYDLWWRGTWKGEGGGCTFIHAVHHIDLFLWMLGNVGEVSAIVSNLNHDNSEVEDLSVATVRFENGAIGTIVSSLLHHGEEQKLIMDAKNGSIEIPHRISVSRQQANGYPEPDEERRVEFEKRYGEFKPLEHTDHCGQIENMLLSVEKGTQPFVSGDDGRRTIEFISAVYQSAFSGKPVKLPMKDGDPFYTKEGILRYAVRFHEKTKSLQNLSGGEISVGGSL